MTRGEQSVLSQLGQILSVSNRNNKAVDISGALIFDDLWFVQALEGDRKAVWQKFQRICDDERHGNIVLVEMRDIEERLFGNWWMGLADHNERTHAAFAPYLRHDRLSPVNMSASALLTLMINVAKLGLSREVLSSAILNYNI